MSHLEASWIVRSICRGLGAALTVIICLVSSLDAADIVVNEQDGVASVKVDGRQLIEYRSQPNPMKLYVSKLSTPAGTQVLRDSPHDHVHHRALMYAVGIDGADFWSEVPAQDYGKQVPASAARISGQLTDERGRFVIEQEVNWESPQNELLATESRVITVHVGEVENVALLTWAFTLTPTERKPQVELWGRHYFGLGVRFIESMDTGSTFVTPANEEGVTVRGTETLMRAHWCACQGTAGGKPVTIAMFNAPENPRHPATWFTMTAPFAYLSATMNLDAEKLTISRDKPLKAKYGVALWDGTADKTEIERAYQAWRALP
ncbi:MAG: DUF6807 family protein [Pirellulaceae bacterium]